MPDRKLQSERELKDYERRKQEERERIAGEATAHKDPEWERRRHADPERDPNKPEEAAKDAQGQDRRGHIDQVRTSKGYTQSG